MTTDNLGFTHRFISAAHAPTTAPTLLLLHGTGGDENDLLPLARSLCIEGQANLLSPRGRVLENGAPRFFRRLAEGVFDEADVVRRAAELAEFVRAAARYYVFDQRRVIAVGYSNGANIAAATMLLHPATLYAAALFHAQSVLSATAEALSATAETRLDAVKIFLSGGRADPIVAATETQRLCAALQKRGAHVTLSWQPGGHALTMNELDEARVWLNSVLGAQG